jgi:GTP1/Obg family GTP-binding protein
MGKGGKGRKVDAAERRRLRELKRSKQKEEGGQTEPSERVLTTSLRGLDDDARIVDMLAKNEDELLSFVAMVNKVYEQKLHKVAPFMTFVFVGMQSTGKSTIMERFMNAPLNIVQEGTGTRCPLDTTCIHDEACTEPVCELYGDELLPSQVGKNLSVNTIFTSIVAHNKRLGEEDRFSTHPIRLHYRANNVQNMRFVDTPGIIETQSTVRLC